MGASKFRFNHMGVPSNEPMENETYLPQFDMWVAGYEKNDFNIERMRFEPESGMPELLKTVPHVAFEVDDLEEALRGREVIIQPNSPSEGVVVAFVVENGVPVELMQFSKR